ncbi:hypothetical protein TNIN_219781 [Trichonephila inaurata madagascariensis]|uniref:Uncharacterized protein n=1 Tax=Trichonephila inaurata madagascariensis TaxID=2747483 RepID=A0A8X7CB64_9ARAC|nr:hypothetical protein TNIN_219781 [Trichonephila inaurata madagascariensis]
MRLKANAWFKISNYFIQTSKNETDYLHLLESVPFVSPFPPLKRHPDDDKASLGTDNRPQAPTLVAGSARSLARPTAAANSRIAANFSFSLPPPSA